jgi:hypothetical protein
MTEPEGGLSPTGDYPGRGADQGRLDDAKSIERARAAGPGSTEVELLKSELLDMGLGVLHALNRASRLIPSAKLLLRCSLPEPPSNWSSVADGVIYLAVTLAVKRFINALFDGRRSWQPSGGASLETYFINGCLFSFAEVYRRDHEERAPAEVPCADIHDDAYSNCDDHQLWIRRRATDDPESRAIDADTLRRLGPKLTDNEKRFAVARADDMTYEEIGRAHGTTGDAVSSSLRRLRHRIGC